jgi:hypothetical protein
MPSYDDFLNEYESRRAASGRAGIAASSTLTYGVDPDAAGRARQTAQFLGMPPAAVEAMPEEASRQAEVEKIHRDTTAAPVLRAKYSDADFMKLARDDSGVLSRLEGAISGMFSPAAAEVLPYSEEAFRGAQAAGRAVRGTLGEPFQRPMPARGSQGRVGETFIRRGELHPDEGSVTEGLFSADRFRSMSAGMSIAAADALGLDPTAAIRRRDIFSARAAAAGPQFQSTTAQAIYGGLESIVSNAPGLAASFLTMNPAPALAWAGLQQGGEAYGKYRSRGGTPGQAAAGALGEGAVEVATELLPMGFLVNKFGRAGAGEFITGLLAREIPGEQVATFVQDAIDTAIANPEKTWAQFWAERPGAAYQTAISTLVQSGVMAGAGSVLRNTAMRHQAEQYEAEKAQQQAAAFQQLTTLAAASKVRERDAATFEGFLQSATEDGSLEKVYVNPKDVQAAGIDLTQLAQVAPSAAAQITQALQTGQDVAIPTAELMTRLPGTELEQSLVEHLKTDPGGFSAAGAQAYMQTQAETARAEVEKALAEHQVDTAFKDSARAVEQNVLGQLTAANRFTEDVNGPYAAMWANFFAVQAARLKVMPEDLFNQFAPRIVAQGPVSESVLEQQGDRQQAPTTQAEAAVHPEVQRLTQREDALQKLLECIG